MQKPTITKEDLAPGEGAIIESGGQKLAAYKNDQGEIITLSPVCPHLGCLVKWNSDDKSWDCPCHGSRFSIDGKVFKGPANKDLPKKQIL